MTELQVFLTYVLNLPMFYGKSVFVSRLARHLNNIISHNDLEACASTLLAMLELDDAIVVGLNSKRFEFSNSTFSCYPQSVLPKFFYGLISQIFEDDGQLRQFYSADAVEAVLTGLRLVRRASVPGRTSVTDKVAVEEFLAPQGAPVPPVNPKCEHDLKSFYTWLLRDFDDEIRLGFPGTGVTSNMVLPYVPRLSFVNLTSCPAPVRTIMHRAMLRALPDTFDVTSPCDLIRFYDYKPYEERVGSISVVPKSFKTGRAITITDTASVIIGATFRETVWQCARRRGVLRMMNVHDQQRSRDILSKFPLSTVQLDLKGGSNLVNLERQRLRLSGVSSALKLLNFSVLSGVMHKGEWFPVTTLSMGDANSVANLTSLLYGVITLADIYERFGDNVTPQPYHFDNSATFLNHEGCTAVVGDDMQFHKRLLSRVYALLGKIGAVVNKRKSSLAGANHKETCGGWVIWDPREESYRSIYPFRAPMLTNDLVSDLATITRAYERCSHSKFSLTVFLAFSTHLTHLLEFVHYEAFRPDHIGSVVGQTALKRTVRPRPAQQSTLPDDVAYAFGFPESRCTPRRSRRPDLVRGRIAKFRDFSRESGTIPVSFAKVRDTAYKAGTFSRSLGNLILFSSAIGLTLTLGDQTDIFKCTA